MNIKEKLEEKLRQASISWDYIKLQLKNNRFGLAWQELERSPTACRILGLIVVIIIIYLIFK